MKNLLATLTLGLSGAVLFVAHAPNLYAQQTEIDDLYFTAADRNSVEVVKLNERNSASYDRNGSYVYKEEVASKNFNPDAVDVERYTSDREAEESQAEYYVAEEDRQFNNNQFNGARPSYATFGNPAFAGARMWNDPFYNPYWGRGFGNPYWGSMAFYDPFFDPFWGPGPGFGWGMRPGFNISFGFGFGNAWGWGGPGFGWGRPGFGWGRPWGWGGGYTAGFYDGLAFGNPYNRFGFCPPGVVAFRNNVIVDNRTIVNGSRRASRSVDRRRATDTQYASTRSRANYTASRDAYATDSKNPLYGRGRSRTASGNTSAATRYRSASPTQSTATRNSRSYTPARVQRPRSNANSTYSPRTRSTAPSSQARRYNSGSNSNYSRSYGNSNRSRSYGSGSSSYGSTRSRGSNSYSSPSRSRSSGSYSSGSRGGGSSYGRSSGGGSSRGRRGGR
ncbi:MAG: hypothetical protein AAF992_03420 [Bacteroidota bacterium]